MRAVGGKVRAWAVTVHMHAALATCTEQWSRVGSACV